ncbi:hypothetical protein [Microbacterium allomyrinae]|uniref:Uncharacterized protein n=1 Tax=Microbacterium allomyrinae TaxID=2830666 RepID=A0A9X1LU58_9MICO|nr:hypothetical protein [Microbacterium allomyrinae]MCC2032197.1 hypothetical protein [Microbacterium allomyrinae]
MAKGYTVGIASETKAFKQGIESGVIDPLEDAQRELLALGRSRGPEQLETDLKGAQKATEKLSEEIDTTRRDLERMGRSGKDSAQDIGEGLSTVKDEARQSGKEAAASFSGEFDDVADFVQEVIANAFEGFGPAGAAAGIAVAAVIGTVLSNAQAAQEKLADAREKAVDLASTMYENGGKLPIAERVEELLTYLGSERLARNPVEKIADNFVDLGTNIDEARDAARTARVPFEDLVKALSGSNLSDSRSMLSAINDELARLDRAAGDVDLTAWQEQKDALSNVKTELESVIKQSELARDLYNSTEFLSTQKLESLAEAWRNAAVDAGGYFTQTEEGATSFDWSAYLTDGEATIAAADEMKARLVGMPPDIKAEAERIFAEQGAVSANEYTKAYESASAADKSRFISMATANGEAAGLAQANALKNAFGTPQLEAVAKVRLDKSEWDRWVPNPKTGVLMAQVSRTINEWE